MITSSYVLQDFQMLIENPSNYVITEPTTRVLARALSETGKSRVAFLPVSKLKSEFVKCKLQACESDNTFRVQYIIQLPIRCGVHYVAADVEFSPAGTSCILIDAAMNKESLGSIKKLLAEQCSSLYFAASCKEINYCRWTTLAALFFLVITQNVFPIGGAITRHLLRKLIPRGQFFGVISLPFSYCRFSHSQRQLLMQAINDRWLFM